MDPGYLWEFLPRGYLESILIETPVLLIGLSRIHSLKTKLFSGVWLTACTYPIVVLVLPCLISMQTHHATYLLVAESFAPLAECALFWAAFIRGNPEAQPGFWRDMLTITVANLCSFGFGEILNRLT